MRLYLNVAAVMRMKIRRQCGMTRKAADGSELYVMD